MNRYGQIVADHNRTHRPDAYSQIPEPDAFFAEAGEAIATAISDLRDQILGPPRPGEDLDTYRRRGYQAWATAEEIVLADHHLLQPEPNPMQDRDDYGDLADRQRVLAEINEAINLPL